MAWRTKGVDLKRGCVGRCCQVPHVQPKGPYMVMYDLVVWGSVCLSQIQVNNRGVSLQDVCHPGKPFEPLSTCAVPLEA